MKNQFFEKLKQKIQIDGINYLIHNYWNSQHEAKKIKSKIYDNVFIDKEHYKLLHFCPSPIFIDIRNILNMSQNKYKIILLSNYNLYLKIFHKLFIHEMIIRPL